jgi:hypothetical protein
VIYSISISYPNYKKGNSKKIKQYNLGRGNPAPTSVWYH